MLRLLFLPRDSLRVFSSLCQVFSEEDNYSQSRGLLMQVRPVLLSLPLHLLPPPNHLVSVTTRK